MNPLCELTATAVENRLCPTISLVGGSVRSVALAVGLAMFVGLAAWAEDPAANAPAVGRLTRLADGLYCSAEPRGEAAFAHLADLGIKTVLSVDGTTPDSQAATAAGLRYVHLPIGYDGLTDAQILSIARAIRDLPGPTVVHCHHGKHRGPAAAVAAAIVLDRLPPTDVPSRLEKLGTDRRYRGLYAAAKRAGTLDRSRINEAPSDFPAVSPIPPLAERMVALTERFETLQRAVRALEPASVSGSGPASQSAPPPEDATMAEVAALFRQDWTELRRDEAPRPTDWTSLTPDRQDAWTTGLALSESEARRLERVLAEAASARSQTSAPVWTSSRIEAVRAAMRGLEHQCNACHEAFRN